MLKRSSGAPQIEPLASKAIRHLKSVETGFCCTALEVAEVTEKALRLFHWVGWFKFEYFACAVMSKLVTLVSLVGDDVAHYNVCDVKQGEKKSAGA